MLKRHQTEGTIEPKPHTGGFAGKLANHLDLVQQLVEQDNDATLEELCAQLEQLQLLRQEYWEEIRDIRAEDLVFIDETGVNLMMVRLYTRALKGERATGERPDQPGSMEFEN